MLMMPGTGLARLFPATKALNSTTFPLSSLSFKGLSLNLSSNGSRATGFSQWVLGRQSAIHPRRQGSGFEPVTIVAAKGYKMKTHKVYFAILFQILVSQHCEVLSLANFDL